jgi:2,5-diamino-6-(ribosylamino)-4(3H)-pyrimidinone 5'-phosphate reductase
MALSHCFVVGSFYFVGCLLANADGSFFNCQPMALPFVYVNFAITADGKIAPANRVFKPFSSKADQELLMELRTCADAVMAGARTVDRYPVNLGPGGRQRRAKRKRLGLSEYNLRVVVSGSGTLNPHAEIFKHRFSPIVILVSERVSDRNLRKLQSRADEVKVCGRDEVDFVKALEWLRAKWKIKRLLCEGGGALNEALFRAGVVDELYLTISPVIFGGRDAPTLADGRGVEHLPEATPLKLKSYRRIGDEVFLVFRAGRKRR